MHHEILPSTDIQISHDVTSLGLGQDTAEVINAIQFAGPLFSGGSLMHWIPVIQFTSHDKLQPGSKHSLTDDNDVRFF